MGLSGYPLYLPGVMKLMNNYIVESGKNRSFRKNSRKYQTGFAFTQTQEKYAKEKKKINNKGESQSFHWVNKYN